jgi:hypothetical protein
VSGTVRHAVETNDRPAAVMAIDTSPLWSVRTSGRLANAAYSKMACTPGSGSSGSDDGSASGTTRVLLGAPVARSRLTPTVN